MRLAIVSDTHLPKGARQLPHSCVARLAAADLIVHTGDFTEVDAESGFQLFDPGSPTERRRAPSHTMGLAEVGDGVLRFELVDLDATGRAKPATH